MPRVRLRVGLRVVALRLTPGTRSGLLMGLVAAAKRLTWTFLATTVYRTGLLRVIRRLARRFELQRSNGGLPLVRRSRAQTFQILLYHRVGDHGDPFLPPTPRQVFERQMAHLARNYTVLTLDSVLEAILAGDLPDDVVVVTFDDGYRDFYTDAFPVLKRLSLTATVFLATGVIGNDRILWYDRVFRAFELSRVPRLCDFGPAAKTYEMGTAGQRCGARDDVLGYLKSLYEEDRAGVLHRLMERLEVDDIDAAPGLMLSWEEVREMSREGICFGSHTVTHPVLSRIPRSRARAEIRESRIVLERELGVSVKGFAYPNGQAGDFDDVTVDLLHEAGYECAVTTIAGPNRLKTGQGVRDLFRLRREIPWETEISRFATRLVAGRIAGS